MKIFGNIMKILKRCSIADVFKFVLAVALLLVLAIFLIKFILIVVLAGFIIRLVAPYFGWKRRNVKFKHQAQHRYKIVGNEDFKE